MNLFDSNKTSLMEAAFQDITEQEAIAICVFAVTYSDGEMPEAEAIGVAGIISALTKHNGENIAETVLRRYGKILGSPLMPNLVEVACKRIRPRNRLAAFALAAEAVFVQNGANDYEKAILERMAVLLGLEEESARKIVDVMEIRSSFEFM